ncbi:DUF2523 domain-containing protein [Polaromonas sp.]|uniref:DUF2523 domain-containing protein n=1 Tax=Polaromonas sp. TaxID=1869339 RepID=UPI0032634436
MPLFLASLGGMLLRLSGSIAGQVLLSLGIAVITYTGVDVTLTWLKGQAVASFAGLPAEMIALMAYMKIGNCISMIFSAIVVRQTLNGVTSGTFKKWVTR